MLNEKFHVLETKMIEVPLRILFQKKERLELKGARLSSTSPILQIERHQQHMDDLEIRAKSTLKHELARKSDRLESLEKRLLGCSLKSTLNKGFAYFKDKGGKILNSSQSLKAGEKVSATFMDGTSNLRVES